jgi:hypothetical protein
MFHQQLFQTILVHWGGNHKHLIAINSGGQITVFLSLNSGIIKFENGFLIDFSSLNHVVPGYKVDHLAAQFFGKGVNQFSFTINITTVTDDSA